MADDYFNGFGGGDALAQAMRLAMAPNRLAGGQADTQDVIGAIPPPQPSEGLLAALRDKAMRGNVGATNLLAQDQQAKANAPWWSSEGLAAAKPNALGSALSILPPELMLMANFVGPRKAGAMPNAKSPRPEPEAFPQGRSNGASSVLAETDLTIFPDYWVGKHPYERADEVAAALRKAIPAREFRVDKSGSAAGDSAYVKTPLGNIRISDHGANPKPDNAWQGPMDQMNPRRAVELVSSQMQSTIDKLLSGPPPNKHGSPRPNWMTAEEWLALYNQAKK